MKNTIYFLILFLSLIACQPNSKQQPAGETQADSANKQVIKRIDIHTHFRHSRDYLPALHKKWNMQSLLVDVAKADSTGISRSWDSYVAHAKSEPDLFYLCSSLIGVGIDEPDFAQRNIERLSQEIKDGARMVKVWKNFGMVTKDASGKFIQIDDTRLQPIWDFLKAQGIPVMAHIGEPLQAWRPLDDPKNPHYGYYTNHPEYHAYNFPEMPSYETIIAARDNWIEKNPDLKFLIAHFGSMSHDVDMVAERLDKFPNVYAEPAARFGDLAKQDSKKVKAFIEKYQDRILFGSDYGNSTPQDGLSPQELKEEETDLDASYDRLFRYLSNTDTLEIRKQKTIGLGLPADILHKVYFQNASNLLKLE